MARESAQGFIERDGVRLHFREWRAEQSIAEPALFLLHGLSSNALFWQRLADLLPWRRIVALDQRSHGLSDRPPTRNDAGTLVQDAAFAITALMLERPVVGGHSWGSSIALELAATRPELAGGLFFLDGPVQAMSNFMTWDEAASRMQPPFPVYPSYLEAHLAHDRALGAAWAPDLQAFVEAGLVPVPGGYSSTLTPSVRLQMLRGMYAFQPQLLWDRVAGPLWVGLALDRPWAPPAHEEARVRATRELVEARPDARVIWYPSRHDIPLILPQEVAADFEKLALSAAWRRLAERAAALEGDFSVSAQGDQGTWTAHDLLAHLASTQSSMAGVIEGAGGPVKEGAAPFDPDRWNSSQVARRRLISVQQLKDEIRAGEAEIEDRLAQADLTAPVRAGSFPGAPLGQAQRALVRHQAEHLAELERVLGAGRVS